MKCNLNLTKKQIKIKIPNLKSITFNSFYFPEFNTVDESDSIKGEKRKMFMNVDSVTTAHYGKQSIEDIVQWLFHISPNLENVSGSSSHKITGMFVHLTKSDYVYSSNVKHVKIEFWMDLESISNKYVPYRLKKILEIFQNSKILTFYFHLFC